MFRKAIQAWPTKPWRQAPYERGSHMNDERQGGEIHVTGVVKDRVGEPRNDGSRGSGLYSVPLQLSRKPSHDWAGFFERAWNNPPSFTTMHRPGIASVVGDTIVLNGTTIDEVETYHLTTVKLCIGQATHSEAEYQEAERQRAGRADAERKEHQAHVDDVADRIRFDE